MVELSDILSDEQSDFSDLSDSKKKKQSAADILAAGRSNANSALKNMNKQLGIEDDDDKEDVEVTKTGKVEKNTKTPYTEVRKISKGVYHYYNGKTLVLQRIKASKSWWEYKDAKGRLLTRVKRKHKKKKGFFRKVGRITKGTFKAVVKNPFVKGALVAALPGVGAGIATAITIAQTAKDPKERKKAIAMLNSPEFEKAQDDLESKLIVTGANYGIKTDDPEAAFEQLVELKKSGKIKEGSPADQVMAAFAAVQSADEELVQPAVEGGIPGPVLWIGGLIGLATIYKIFK